MTFARNKLKDFFPDINFEPARDTKPIGMYLRTMEPFSNQIAKFSSQLSPNKVKALLKVIEREAGRTPQEKQLEIIRLDIDLLMADEHIYKNRIE